MACCRKYDVYLEEISDSECKWLEGKCDEKDCEFCSVRPATPQDCDISANCFSCSHYD